MNAITKQQLMDKVIRAIEKDSRISEATTTGQLKQASERLAGQVRKVESVFQRAGQTSKR